MSTLDEIDAAAADDRVVVPSVGSGGYVRDYRYHEPVEAGSVRVDCGNVSYDGQLLPRSFCAARGIDPCARCFPDGDSR